MKTRLGVKSSKALGVSCLALFTFMLLFRAAIYPRMYIAPDSPYGTSDVVEYFLGWGFLVLLLVSVIAAVAIVIWGHRQSKKWAGGLVVLCVVLALSFGPLHSLAARWSF